MQLQILFQRWADPRDLYFADTLVTLRELDKHASAMGMSRRVCIVHTVTSQNRAIDDWRYSAACFDKGSLPARGAMLAMRHAKLNEPFVDALQGSKEFFAVKWTTQDNSSIVWRIILGMVLPDLIDGQNTQGRHETASFAPVRG